MFLPLGDDLRKDTLPVVTLGLILVNVLVFAFMFNQHLTGEFMTLEDSDQNQRVIDCFGMWGLVPKDLCEGHVLGLLTNIFIHATIFHLIGNMIVLWAFGPSLESLLGSATFAVMYVLWGVIAGLTQVGIDLGSEMPLVGASGAIAGVIGGYMMMFGYAARIQVFMFIFVFPLKFFMPASVFGFLWIMSQLWNASFDISGDLSGVAWMCHVGGFFAGMIMMAIFKNQTDRVLLQSNNGDLVFRNREEYEDAQVLAEDPEAALAAEVARLQELVESQKCSECGTQLGSEHLIADRLLRCPNERCSHLNYVEVDHNLQMIGGHVAALDADRATS